MLTIIWDSLRYSYFHERNYSLKQHHLVFIAKVDNPDLGSYIADLLLQVAINLVHLKHCDYDSRMSFLSTYS